LAKTQLRQAPDRGARPVHERHAYVFGGCLPDQSRTVRLGAVHGGAPSGWVGQTHRVTPIREEHWSGHYTPVPVIYIQVKKLDTDERLAVRLLDDQGRYWVAKPEPQGNGQGIKPFLLELPAEVKTIVTEFVLLRPVHVEFTVQVPVLPGPTHSSVH